MYRRLFFLFLLALVCVTALGGLAERASAAIRVSISDGLNTKVFYATSSNAAMIFTDIGAYDLFLHTAVSNFPGDASGGSLTQTIQVTDAGTGSGTLPTLTVTADLINSVAGLSNGEVTGANLSAVLGSSLLLFTQPTGSPLTVSSDISSVVGGSATGTVQNITTVNGSVVSSLAVGAGSDVDALQVGTAANPGGYSLSSQVVLAGANVGVSGLAIVASSSAAASLTPEPGSLVVWGLGAIGMIVVAAANRRRLRSSPG